MNDFALIKSLLDRPLRMDAMLAPWMRSSLSESTRPMSDLERASFGFWPAIELRETKDSLVCTLDVPGIRESDISVVIANNVLTISGKRESHSTDDGSTFHAVERTYGSFKRSMTLPEAVDVEHVVATLEHGVLTVLLSKAVVSSARTIAVKAIGRSSKS